MTILLVQSTRLDTSTPEWSILGTWSCLHTTKSRCNRLIFGSGPGMMQRQRRQSQSWPFLSRPTSGGFIGGGCWSPLCFGRQSRHWQRWPSTGHQGHKWLVCCRNSGSTIQSSMCLLHPRKRWMDLQADLRSPRHWKHCMRWGTAGEETEPHYGSQQI